MALLDFIRNRNTSQQQPVANKRQQQKPETAKEMYSREAGQGRGAQKLLHQMPPDQQAKVEAIKATLEKATQHIDKSAQMPPPARADDAGNREAMRQNMAGQDKKAPSLSPTSTQAGRAATEKTPAPSNESSTKTHEKHAGRVPQTVPRRPPSWER